MGFAGLPIVFAAFLGHSGHKLSRRVLSLNFRYVYPVLLLVGAVSLGGCSENFKLVRFNMPSPNGWVCFAAPRPPTTAIEEAIVEVAQTKGEFQVDYSDVYYISETGAFAYVALVERFADTDRFSRSWVTRFRVADGGIVGHTATVAEVFFDADFERAVLNSVSLVTSPDSVVLYNGNVGKFAISSHPVGKCAAEVRIFDGAAVNKVNRTPVAKKVVNFCYEGEG